jgi:hypothetical protein
MKHICHKLVTRPAYCCYLFIALSCVSCVKSDSIETEPQPPRPIVPIDSIAVFSLKDPGTNCPVQKGYPIFRMGNVLDAEQKVELDVLVSRKGKWTFSTDTINGISFGGQGRFEDTGTTKITLVNVGKPATVGTFRLQARKENNKRLITVAVLPGNYILETVPQEISFKGSLGDRDIQFSTDQYIQVFNDRYDTIRYSAFIGDGALGGQGQFYIHKGTVFNHKNSTEADFKNYFKPGPYPMLVTSCQDFYSDGIVIYYFDQKGRTTWFSEKVKDGQVGSSFTIVGTQDGYSSATGYFVRIKAKVHCQMTNVDGSETKLLDGVFVCEFQRPPSN